MRSAARSYQRSRALEASCEPSTIASVASLTWHTVHSRFSPPQPVAGFCEEQVAHHRQDQVAFQPDPAAALPMIQADFSFTVFEAAFDVPTPEGDLQQLFDRRVRRSIAEEVFDLAREGMIADKQMIRPFRQSAFVFDVDQHVFDSPHKRPFLGILDAPRLPLLFGQLAVRLRQPLDGLRLRGTRHEPRGFSPGAACGGKAGS